MDTTRFPISFSKLGWVTRLGGMARRRSYVDLSADQVTVRAGWAFGASIPHSAIAGARRAPDARLTLGVHGWRGRWLVNGSWTGVVRIDIDPPARAKVLRMPVRLRELTVSLDDPDGFLDALGFGPR